MKLTEGFFSTLCSGTGDQDEHYSIEVRMQHACLILTDTEYQDEYYSIYTVTLNEENTKKAIRGLSEGATDPVTALRNMINYESRLKNFEFWCRSRSISFSAVIEH